MGQKKNHNLTGWKKFLRILHGLLKFNLKTLYRMHFIKSRRVRCQIRYSIWMYHRHKKKKIATVFRWKMTVSRATLNIIRSWKFCHLLCIPLNIWTKKFETFSEQSYISVKKKKVVNLRRIFNKMFFNQIFREETI